jgi:hypothetical protein
MSVHATELRVVATGQNTPAELHDDLPVDSLLEAEELWAPERVRFIRDALRAGVKPDDLPQSIHWNWSLKAIRLPGLAAGALSPYRMFGIRTDDAWQGLLLATCVGHSARLDPRGKDLVYVDFVESAPWNWRCDDASRSPRFRGIGRQLIEMAVRWSIDLGLKGRLSLHSLPQADSFYRDACGLTDLGVDPNYRPPLRYFEFSETQATAFITEAGA